MKAQWTPNSGKMVIGFGGEFFTLWYISNPYKHYWGKELHQFEWRIDRLFKKNLSKDREAAVAKFEKMYPTLPVEVDVDLKGHSRWDIVKKDKKEPVDHEPARLWYVCPYTPDVKDNDLRTYEKDLDGSNRRLFWSLYLNWFPSLEAPTFKQKKTFVLIRTKLVEFGELVKFEGEYQSPKRIEAIKKKRQLNRIKKGFHLTDGQRSELELKEVDSFFFENYYTSFYIKTYKDKEGRAFKYLGNNPPNIDSAKFYKCKGTVNHTEYKGEQETRLKRIALVK